MATRIVVLSERPASIKADIRSTSRTRATAAIPSWSPAVTISSICSASIGLVKDLRPMTNLARLRDFVVAGACKARGFLHAGGQLRRGREFSRRVVCVPAT